MIMTKIETSASLAQARERFLDDLGEWVGACLGAGYLFGNIPVVKENFTLVILGIVFVSVLPIAFEWLRHRSARGSAPRP